MPYDEKAIPVLATTAGPYAAVFLIPVVILLTVAISVFLSLPHCGYLAIGTSEWASTASTAPTSPMAISVSPTYDTRPDPRRPDIRPGAQSGHL